MTHFHYHPTPTLDKFHSDDNFVRVVVGPYGSGKTFACIIESLRRAVAQAPDGAGVRRTRCAIVRQTRPQILTTILPEIQQIPALGPYVDYRPSRSAVYFNFHLPDGTQVSSEWLFMPLEDERDQRRLLSLNLTWAWVSEARELSYDIVQSIIGRLGRYPSQAAGGPTWFGLFGETNPWSVTSKWHENLVLDRPADWRLYKQPGGLDSNAENLANLPGERDYYHRLMKGANQEWIDVHVHAKFGSDLAGTPVYRSTFSSFHVHPGPSPLPVSPAQPLLIGQDFGRTPASLIAQTTPDGRLRVLAERAEENMGIEKYARDYLTPFLKTPRFEGLPHTLIGDPAGEYADQAGEETLFDILRRLGFDPQPAPTNDLDPRLRSVEAALLQQLGGKPMILIDQLNCPLLCQALEFSYKFARKKDGQLEEKPSKTHPWSDLADALGYLCLHVFGAQTPRTTALAQRRGRQGQPFTGSPPFSTSAWT